MRAVARRDHKREGASAGGGVPPFVETPNHEADHAEYAFPSFDDGEVQSGSRFHVHIGKGQHGANLLTGRLLPSFRFGCAFFRIFLEVRS